MSPLRAVIDTQMWVFAFEHEFVDDFESKQPYRAILEALEAGRFIPIFTRETIDELRYILTQSRTVAQRFKIDVGLAEYFIDAITAPEVGAVVVKVEDPPYVCSDPDDDYFIDAAVVAHADLVSEDAHLHETSVKRYLAAHGVTVLYPKQLRKLIEPSKRPSHR